MKYLLLIPFLFSCTVIEYFLPPATPNPVVVASHLLSKRIGEEVRPPVCVRDLDESQRAAFATAALRWPAGYRFTPTVDCAVGMLNVSIDPSLDERFCAYTDVFRRTIKFRSDRCLTACVATHEWGHAIGLIRHAPEDEPGPMSDGERGDCRPSPEDLAILRRTYEGRVNR